jgi:hypothetical protein
LPTGVWDALNWSFWSQSGVAVPLNIAAGDAAVHRGKLQR